MSRIRWAIAQLLFRATFRVMPANERKAAFLLLRLGTTEMRKLQAAAREERG